MQWSSISSVPGRDDDGKDQGIVLAQSKRTRAGSLAIVHKPHVVVFVYHVQRD